MSCSACDPERRRRCLLATAVADVPNSGWTLLPPLARARDADLLLQQDHNLQCRGATLPLVPSRGGVSAGESARQKRPLWELSGYTQADDGSMLC